jgi:hypothetical protein
VESLYADRRDRAGGHFFVLAPDADGTTRLTHGETFSGALVALVKLFGKGNLEKNHNGYDDFNRALKQRAETVPAAGVQRADPPEGTDHVPR